MEKMTDIMEQMKMVKEPGLQAKPKEKTQTYNVVTGDNSRTSMTNASLAYEAVMKQEKERVVSMQEANGISKENLTLSEDDKMKVLGAIQVIKEMVNDEKDPLGTLQGIKKIIDSFQ